MTVLHHTLRGALVAATGLALGIGAPASAAGNIIPGNWSSLTWSGSAGVLRAGSPWGPGSTSSSAISVVDGAFRPEQTQWNNGSFWWDSTISSPTNGITINLSQTMRFDQFVVQADDNDSYLIEWWDGSAWQNAWAIPAVYQYGLITRNSGPLASSFTTNRLRFTATGGDGYYAVSEIQAFGAVPEPATWGMLILGFGAIGAGMRQRLRHRGTATA